MAGLFSVPRCWFVQPLLRVETLLPAVFFQQSVASQDVSLNLRLKGFPSVLLCHVMVVAADPQSFLWQLSHMSTQIHLTTTTAATTVTTTATTSTTATTTTSTTLLPIHRTTSFNFLSWQRQDRFLTSPICLYICSKPLQLLPFWNRYHLILFSNCSYNWKAQFGYITIWRVQGRFIH